jgi:flagellar basal body P-ring formation protein FlgA
MTLTQARAILQAAIVALAAACASPCVAQETSVPTPKAVIYPGDLILDEMLIDVPNVARDGSGPFVDSRSLIVGKVARLTLLPGHAIPFSGVSNRKVVFQWRGGQAHFFRGGSGHHDDRLSAPGRLDRRHRQGPQ